jgi:glutamate dehydrogenase (NAD(P)+)
VRNYQEIAVADSTAGFEAYLVIYPTENDISFGGTRIDQSVTRDMVVELAENMSLKLAGHGSPVGGAKAGLRASPDDPRLKQYLKQFAEACRDVLSKTTILGKDMGAKQWMIDEIYGALQMPQLGIAQRRNPATECPDRLSALDGYITNMTGQGVFWCIEQALGANLAGARVLIQGFGVVGSGVAWHLHRRGARIVGVSDRNKALFNADGMDLDALLAAKDENGVLAENKLPRSCIGMERDALLTQQADLLVLAAGSYVVNRDVASKIRVPLVAEGANLALTPAARTALHSNSIRVVPDVVANSSSAAMVGHQIASGNTIRPSVLWADIERRIKRNTEAVDRLSRLFDVDPKSAFRRAVEADGCTDKIEVVSGG